MLEILVALLASIILLMLMVGAVGAVIYWSRRPASGRTPSLKKRIDLSNGQWAKVRMHLTQSMWDALVAAQPADIETDPAGRIIDASGKDVTDLVNDQLARALVMAGVTEWSYGPVDSDVMASEVPIEDLSTLSVFLLDEVLARSPQFRRAAGGT